MTVSRRDFLFSTVAIGLSGTTLARMAKKDIGMNSNKRAKKNILLITTDQQRFEYVSFCGRTPVKTPTIDKLAKEGAYHTNAYSINPLCMPARCSILTGLYSHQHGMMNNRGDLSPDLTTLPEILQKHGYETAIVGKEHFLEGYVDFLKTNKYEKICYGFDHMKTVSGKSMGVMYDQTGDEYLKFLEKENVLDKFRQISRSRLKGRKNGEFAKAFELEEKYHVDYQIKEWSLDYLQKRNDDKPFWMWLSFCGPHFPFDPPKKYFDKYNPDDMPKPVDSPAEKLKYYQSYMAAYCGMIEQIDGYIGQVIDELERQGIKDDTLIIFTSDHGDMMGDHGHWAKMRPYEGASHVPFVSCNKDLVKPGVYDTPVELTDITATCLEVANAGDISGSPSESLLGLWQGGEIQRKYAFSETGGQFVSPWYMLTDGIWKYINYFDEGREILFNLEKDPAEVIDYSAQYPEKMTEFRKELLARIGKTAPPIPVEWAYQKVVGKDEPNPYRCNHGNTERGKVK